MNIYEQWAYDRLRQEGFEVFTAYKDKGVDCIVTDGDFEGRHQRIQIKGSRTHGLRTDGTGLGWFQVTDAKLDEKITDFWVFVWADAEQGRWDPIFVVCPAGMLRARLGSRARASANGKLNLYLNHRRDGGEDTVWDTRDNPDPSDPDFDYTRYFEAWQPLWDAVRGKST
ncbi:MAG: hypothetical protein IIA54_07545 [Chloroflexi bacterium]|nr:hypothetical protein [Chloroflexota bacterium]